MLTCWKCGHANADNVRFCLQCGMALVPPTAPSGSPVDPLEADTLLVSSTPAPSRPPSVQQPTELMPEPARQPTRQPTNQAGWPIVGGDYQPYSPMPAVGGAAHRAKANWLLRGAIAVVLLGIIGASALVAWHLYSTFNDGAEVANKNQNENENKNKSNKNGGGYASALDHSNLDDNTTASPTPSPATTFEPPTTPTKEGTVTVYANEGWKVSNIAVVPNEEFSTSIEGMIDLAGAKTGLRASGTTDAKLKSRRLIADFPTGALLMRTRYANGHYSNVTAASRGNRWYTFPDERGMIEFAINDNAPEGNGGQFTVHVKFTKMRKK